MGDVDDVGAFGDDELEDRVAEELAGDRRGDGSESGDLARLKIEGEPIMLLKLKRVK